MKRPAYSLPQLVPVAASAARPPLYVAQPRELCAMADQNSSPISDPLLMPVSGWPMPSLYPFSFRDVVAVLGEVGLVLMSVLSFRRKPQSSDDLAKSSGTSLTLPPANGPRSASPTDGNRRLGTTLHFRFLHIASFMVILPVIAATRLLPRHWHERHDQSVFVETNHAVLTALGFAFMA